MVNAALLTLTTLASVHPCHRISLTRRAAVGTALCGQCFLAPLTTWADAPLVPLCDQDVSVLTAAGRNDIVVIGTAHVSAESAMLVRQVIRSVRPDTVMVELDKPRAVALMRKAKARRNGDLVVSSTPPGQHLTRGQAFYQSLDTMGFEPGREFVAAIEEARLINATVLLGDRDINVTLRRLQEAKAEVRRLRSEGVLSRDDAVEAARMLPKSLDRRNEELTMESVTDMTADLSQRESAVAVAEYMRRVAPPVYEAMIGERDRIMAHALRDAPGKSVVGVVGLSHLEGIERILADELGTRRVQLPGCPVVLSDN